MPQKKKYRVEKKNDKKSYNNKRTKNLKSKSKSKKKNEKKKPSSSKGKRKKIIKLKRLFCENEKTNVFEGIKIVMTGVFSNFKERSDLGEILKKLGAKVTTGVSGVTDVLIHGYELEDGREVSDSRKYKIAQQKGTLIYSELDFYKEYEKKTGKSLLKQKNDSKSYKDFRQKKEPVDMDEEINKNLIEKNQNKLWVDEFKPNNSSDILGNKSILRNLKNWLLNYYVDKKNGKTRQKVKSKAVLISGSPGIGKTSAAKLISKECGYDFITKNASDMRNKKSINTMLTVLSNNLVLSNYYQKKNIPKNQNSKKKNLNSKNEKISEIDLTLKSSNKNPKNNKCVIIMDEVDGMKGDRGGINALIKQISTTQQPIICICNDRDSKVVKTLSNYCYDLRFKTPTYSEIFILLKFIICEKKNLEIWDKIDKLVLNEIILKCNFDIRQIICYLEMWLENFLDYNNSIGFNFKDKNTFLNSFDACKRILNTKLNRGINYKKLENWFFIDYNMMDVIIFENYLTKPSQNLDIKSKKKINKDFFWGEDNDVLGDINQALDSMVIGDKISKKIKRKRNYSLLKPFSHFSSIKPALLFRRFVHYTQFPSYFGKLGMMNKRKRLVKEMKDSFSKSNNILNSKSVIDYMVILSKIIAILMNENNLEELFRLYMNYDITPEIVNENMKILLEFHSKKNPFNSVSSKDKTKFNKYFNSKLSLKGKNLKKGNRKIISKTSSQRKKSKLTKKRDLSDEDNYSDLEDFIVDDYY